MSGEWRSDAGRGHDRSRHREPGGHGESNDTGRSGEADETDGSRETGGSRTRAEWSARVAESAALAQEAETRRQIMLESLAEDWRSVELDRSLRELPRFAAVCEGVHGVRIPLLLLYDGVLDATRSPEKARAFARLGFRIEDDDDRWATATDLADVLRLVLPDARVRSRSSAEPAAESAAEPKAESKAEAESESESDRETDDRGGTTYVVVTGIIGPDHLRGELTSIWSVEPGRPPTLLDLEAAAENLPRQENPSHSSVEDL